jgi:hypothetical protein
VRVWGRVSARVRVRVRACSASMVRSMGACHLAVWSMRMSRIAWLGVGVGLGLGVGVRVGARGKGEGWG